MPLNPTKFEGDICVSQLVREAAERSLQIDVPQMGDDRVQMPFGSGRVCIQEVQPGLRCESNALTCNTDQEFEFLGDPLITGNIILDGNIDGPALEGIGQIESPLNRATLIGFSEPTRWTRSLRRGQYFRSFGFTLQPEFFNRFADDMEDERLSVLDPFRTGRRAIVLPPSQRLIALGHNAFDHPYNGLLDAIYHESNTLQFVLEVVRLLREESQLAKEIGKRHYDRLMHARAIIDGALADPPKTLDLARQVGSNINTLQAHFKIAFGQTIFGYIRMRRLEMARVLITEHNLGSAETGYRVGFSNPAAFTAAYRRHFGSTPSDDRGGGRGSNGTCSSPSNEALETSD